VPSQRQFSDTQVERRRADTGKRSGAKVPGLQISAARRQAIAVATCHALAIRDARHTYEPIRAAQRLVACALLHHLREMRVNGGDMPVNLDNYLGVHTRALQLESRRTELLAANLANADTPGFKARDIDFKQALASATNAANASGAAGTNSLESATQFRVPMAPSLDGNTVDAQLEQAAFAENNVRYQATLTLLNGKLRSLMTAITGQ
jgi:flagellar basal-body rod protein FlgB